MDLRAVARRDVPVLCIDTCSILDIVRNPTRERLRAHDFQAALDLIDHAASGDLTVLVAQQVEIELQGNMQQVQDEADREIATLSRRIASATSIAAVFGSHGQVDLTHLDGHSSRATFHVDRLMALALKVVPSAEVGGRAFLRLNAAIAPARQGKDSSKDCLVFETYLEAMRSLRELGLTAPAAFVSSNTQDYAHKSEIDAELASLTMSYQPNSGAAKHALFSP
jgi:hypothetical protein